VSYIYIYVCVCVCIYIVKPQNEEKFMFESQIFGLRVLEFHVIDYYECKFYQDCDCLVGILALGAVNPCDYGLHVQVSHFLFLLFNC
jgi:hypothetical protein